jgi:hypothetical protein
MAAKFQTSQILPQNLIQRLFWFTAVKNEKFDFEHVKKQIYYTINKRMTIIKGLLQNHTY